MVMELQHTAQSVPRDASATRERLADEGDVEWDLQGTKVDGRSTPIRPRPDNF